MTYDLVVAYRICPVVSKIPPAYPKDKYKLSKLCLESFKESVKGLKIKMIVLLDSCPPEYVDIFKDNFSQDDLEIINLTNCGNKGTFKKQIELLSQQNYSDIVYFAEDDYFYIKNIGNMLNFLRSGLADFVTPYEHPVVYSDRNVIKNETIFFEEQEYTTVQHACLTFMTTKKKLMENKKYLSIFSNWFGSDFVVWGCVTLGWRYFKYLKLLLNFRNFNIENLKVFGSMFFFAWYRFVFNKKDKLFMPVNTISTHMESNFLSPNVDWSYYFKDRQ